MYREQKHFCTLFINKKSNAYKYMVKQVLAHVVQATIVIYWLFPLPTTSVTATSFLVVNEYKPIYSNMLLNILNK